MTEEKMVKYKEDNVPDADKVRVLERLLTAIVGRQDAEVKYRSGGGMLDQVIVKCDPDDILKIRSALGTAEIEIDFYVTQKEVPVEDRSSIFPEPYEGICEVTFYLEEQYWKTSEKLKEELKAKEAEIVELKKKIPNELKDEVMSDESHVSVFSQIEESKVKVTE